MVRTAPQPRQPEESSGPHQGMPVFGGSRPPKPNPIDPWQHRAEHMRCKTCMWYAPKKDNVGRCRRHAPTMNGYPVVFVTDWCGDHKLNEEAR